MLSASRIQQLGAYQLGDRLGIGGMAEVFGAESPQYGRVALKRILPGLAEDREFVGMFWDEARITSRLDHPNIVRILDYGEADSQLYMALEYVDGPTLARVLRKAAKSRQALSLPVLVGIMVQLLDALDYVHSAVDDAGKPLGIIHRDVSPGNVMLTSDGQAKLGDFGIVRSRTVTRRTQPGELKGKIGYMSPEQAIGDTVNRQSDLFSVGIILAEFLTLRPLFLGKSEMQTLTRTVHADLSTWHRHNGSVPLGLRVIVEKALKRELDQRFHTAKEMRAALLEVARSSKWELRPGAIVQELRGLDLLATEEMVSGERPVVRAPEGAELDELVAHPVGAARRPQGRPVWDVVARRTSLPSQLFLALRRAWDGVVELSHEGDSLSIELRGGRIVATHDSSGAHPLGRLLIDASLLDMSGLVQAIGSSRRANLKLGEFLVLHGRLRESILQRLLRRQMELRLGPWLKRPECNLSLFLKPHAKAHPEDGERMPASLAEVVGAWRASADASDLQGYLEEVMDAVVLPVAHTPLTAFGLTEPEVRAVRTTLDGGAYEGRSVRSVIESVVGERISRRHEVMFALSVALSAGVVQAPGFGR